MDSFISGLHEYIRDYKKKSNTNLVQVKITDELLKHIQEVCASTGMSQSDFVRTALYFIFFLHGKEIENDPLYHEFTRSKNVKSLNDTIEITRDRLLRIKNIAGASIEALEELREKYRDIFNQGKKKNRSA